MSTVIGRDQVQQLVVKGATLLEVMPAAEYDEEHLPGAINIPLKQLSREAVSTLDASKPVITYCHDNQ